MKTTFKILVIAALYTGTTANAQVTTIDSIATSKVQHFNFDEMASETIGEGIKRKWFHGEKGQMTIFDLEEGAHIPWHQHPNEQITYIMSGKVKIKTLVDGKEEFVIVSGGEVIVFPENVPHEFWALEKTVDLDVHVPVREDWLSKELPDYLKKSE
ncbi:cupin domain-containing protein [Zobellia galactanivorans]|uniref:cupin domain-containing protein n=1 Tax=Zobellia galactanivorans (strain DSM 12802 / CCUG 47099 / CIP 106680 / NCIMB 13871 / Dsij) TaxID=63186 RepID=UPI001C076A4A|nr:cupin domain-containing protein [Zobellia galactanivorans]MBU3024925.1 cupin domain-containing protein [Zobellia galactanivorans]MDO6808777.1 cupin domain-containing protein [Zobellia galactanivorans]